MKGSQGQQCQEKSSCCTIHTENVIFTMALFLLLGATWQTMWLLSSRVQRLSHSHNNERIYHPSHNKFSQRICCSAGVEAHTVNKLRVISEWGSAMECTATWCRDSKEKRNENENPQCTSTEFTLLFILWEGVIKTGISANQHRLTLHNILLLKL